MTKPTIVSEQPITMAELSEELDGIRARDKDLNMRAQKTDDYIKGLKVDAAKDKKMLDRLQKLDIPRLKDQPLMKLVDVKPKSVEEVKAVLSAYMVTVSQDNLKKIVEVITG